PDAGDEARFANVATPRNELESHLRTAVRRRLRSDAPLAAYISGGLDSSVILTMATRENGGPVPSLTIGLEGAGVDERSAATQTAGNLGSPVTTLVMNDRAIVDRYPELVGCSEMPVMDTSCACLMELAHVATQHGYKVILTGE